MRTGACVRAVGVLTGWGEGVTALPVDARTAATAHPVIRLTRPLLAGERFRRATRECLLGVAAVEQMLSEAGLDREAIAGSRTALLFVTAAAYGASNVEFIAGRAGTLHFPYTAPSTLSAEVAIEFGLTGAYVILIGGAAATVDALRQASRLLQDGRCDRALVLAVETFDECEDLWRRARWALPAPLVEAAVCALLVPAAGGEARRRNRSRRSAGDRGAEAGGQHAGVRTAHRPGAGARGRRADGERHRDLAGTSGHDRLDDDRARGPELTNASGRIMQPKEVFDELKTILVTRLKFDPRRAAEVTEATALPKGVEGSIGLDSLDFIELSLAIEERFGLVLDESEDLTAHFASFDPLSRFIAEQLGGA